MHMQITDPRQLAPYRWAVLTAAGAAAAMLFLHAGPANAQANAPGAEPALAPAPAPRFTVDTPLRDVMANDQGREVVNRIVPALAKAPHYEQALAYTLQQISKMVPGAITKDELAALQRDLALIP